MNPTAPDSGAQGTVSHNDMANAIRALAMDAVEQAKSGHPGMPMGMADVATVLFTRFLKYDPRNPIWPDRDRFVLSAGHGSMLLYSLLYLAGYERMSIEQLKNFRQLLSHTPGHPEIYAPGGIETTTGPLGQGFANAVGMALAERILNARFGDELIDHHTYVIAGDGDLMEGISHEAASLAGHLGLGRLIVLWDDNEISIDGPTSLSFSDDNQARFRAYGWDVRAVDGHKPDDVARAIQEALAVEDRPSLIACRTIIGYGAPKKQGTAATHGSPLGADEIAGVREKLGWPHPPFEVPPEILDAWREAGRRGHDRRGEWQSRHDGLEASKRDLFDRAYAGELPADLGEIIGAYKAKIIAEKPKLATRVASGQVLEVLAPAIPELTGGSADLTPSNNTRVGNTADIKNASYDGRYIRYGVREHGMAGAMNGLALHGGIIPYGGTFLTFSDYCRPSIRLSALMKQRVIYVMTHDSIGLGEDGPTHQPVEHLAALRTIPNLLVLRPADGVETAECWEIALERQDGPSLLALTRQNLATVRAEAGKNLARRGGYVLASAEGEARVTILATGSEVEIALAGRALLQAEGIGASVVSMPSFELFDAQDEAYRASVLPMGTVKVAVEAAVKFGWERYIGTDGVFIGMSSFGESAPHVELYKHFGITAEAVSTAAKRKLA